MNASKGHRGERIGNKKGEGETGNEKEGLWEGGGGRQEWGETVGEINTILII